jgi:hypothetical protein
VSESKIVWVRVPYLVHAVAPRCRTLETLVLQRQEPVAIRCVDPDQAEISITARWPAGNEPTSLHWRLFENAFWRPVLSPETGEMLEPGDFERLLGEEEPDWDWDDYPFRGKFRNPNFHREPFGLPEAPSPGWRVKGDEMAEAVARTQALAANDVILVGNILHRRALPPMWTVGSLYRFNARQEISLTMPEFGMEGLCLFSPNRHEDALAFAEQTARRAPSDLRDLPGLLWPMKAQEIEVMTFHPAALPDDHALSFVGTRKLIGHFLQRMRFGKLPRNILSPYMRLADTCEQLLRGSCPDKRERLVTTAIDAINAVSACVFPLSQPDKELLDQAVRMARLQQWRTTFETEQADARAFAGI